jgi:glycosyltransferase involved in cell wall biosynthesis
MKQKLKILMCSEASFLSSGFSTYVKEILNRLYKTGKYDIAEFASYGIVNDPRDKDIPWRYYANAVRDNDPRHKEYTSRGENQFGRWRFEKVLLDFQPDVVIDVRDYWMTAYQAQSPLRKYFHWILMPTVDSEPQQEEWIDTFISADSVFTYSDWGADVLKRQSSNHINYIDTTSPGVDLDTFKIIPEKTELRGMFNIPSDSFIIGSVMRNQKRKLIPELMTSFRKSIDLLKDSNPELGSKLFLYLHTSYPDAGWDIPELLKENRIANKVLFTYVCKKCNTMNCSTFVGASKVCGKCLEKSMVMPSVTNGINTTQLSMIYNLFDIYVQYSICEGFGMPQVEAGACGLPIITVDYSAMCDIVKKLEATPINPKTKFKELETKAIRVYPDNDQLVKEIINYANMPKPMLLKKGQDTRQLTEKHYNWDTIASKWENHLDKIDETYRADWNISPQYLSQISEDIKTDHKNFFEVTSELCSSFLKDPSQMSSMSFLTMLKEADYGFSLHGTNIQKYPYTNILDYVKTVIDNNNQAEHVRSNKMKFSDDFIEYAHIKEQTK